VATSELAAAAAGRAAEGAELRRGSVAALPPCFSWIAAIKLALAHAGRTRDPHLLRNLLQLWQPQRGKTSPLAAAPGGRRSTIRPGWPPRATGVWRESSGPVFCGRRTTEGGFPGRIRRAAEEFGGVAH